MASILQQLKTGVRLAVFSAFLLLFGIGCGSDSDSFLGLHAKRQRRVSENEIQHQKEEDLGAYFSSENLIRLLHGTWHWTGLGPVTRNENSFL